MDAAMSEPRWVCHISGQGAKWKLANVHYNDQMEKSDWNVEGDNTYHYLPKSEYHLCEPPER